MNSERWTRSVERWACAKCDTLWVEEKQANACCQPVPCEGCGNPCRFRRCAPCESAHERKLEEEAFAKAKRVPLSEYTGSFLYRDGHGNDGYFDSEEPPEGLDWAWSCSAEHASLDLDQTIREDVLLELGTEHHENACDQVDWPRIKLAQGLITEALKDVVTYQEDRSVAVILR